MHKCKKKSIKIIPHQSKIKRNSGRTSVTLNKPYHIEFNHFACSLLASIRAEGVSEFTFRYESIKPALQAALKTGERHYLRYKFSTAAPSCFAHDWLTTCAMYGLLAPGGYKVKILLGSPHAALDYLDHQISKMHLHVADTGIFRKMAKVFIETFEQAAKDSNHRYMSTNEFEEAKSEYP